MRVGQNNTLIYFFFDSHRKADEPESSTSVPGMNSITASDIQAAGITLTAADFDAALGEARASYSDSIGAPKVNFIKTKCMLLYFIINIVSYSIDS